MRRLRPLAWTVPALALLVAPGGCGGDDDDSLPVAGGELPGTTPGGDEFPMPRPGLSPAPTPRVSPVPVPTPVLPPTPSPAPSPTPSPRSSPTASLQPSPSPSPRTTSFVFVGGQRAANGTVLVTDQGPGVGTSILIRVPAPERPDDLVALQFLVSRSAGEPWQDQHFTTAPDSRSAHLYGLVFGGVDWTAEGANDAAPDSPCAMPWRRQTDRLEATLTNGPDGLGGQVVARAARVGPDGRCDERILEVDFLGTVEP